MKVGLVVVALLVAPHVFGVRDGLPTADRDKSVFLSVHVTPGTPGGPGEPAGEPTIEYCTIWNTKYDRCMVTAAHCENAVVVYSGEKPVQTVEKVQLVDSVHPYSNYDEWTDLQVIWMKNLQDGTIENQMVERIQEGRDYVAIPFGPDAGIENVLDTGVFPGTKSDTNKAMELMGYGRNAGAAGAGEKREGAPGIYNFSQGSLQTIPRTGSKYHVLPLGSDSSRIGCKGDSGAPLLVDGTSYGVLSGVIRDPAGGDCDDVIGNIFSGFDDGVIVGEISNEQWLEDTTEKFCKKDVNALWTADDSATGKVTGSIAPAQIYTVGDPFNDSYDCAAFLDNGTVTSQVGDDCIESIHQNQEVSLSAEAGPNSKFVEWQSFGDATCSCDGGNGSNPCVVKYATVGEYDVDTSIDEVFCVAKFEED